ncbi:MAG TPA: TetR/AcrR family transcriptional regulator [Candidatus Ornithospirochaeta stercorigallinarum]|nr:TetR/AcrR family transcriptional regulator [Candidatus Ornithospirochaeta stercorigallinarum]
MPKTYTETERDNIRRDLRKAASLCLRKYGVRHTTVDELVHMVNIPKGTFYLFYPNKESLFLDALVTFTKEEEGKYLELLEELDENHIVTSLTTVFFEMAISFYNSGLYRFLDDNQLAIVMRNLDETDKVRFETSRTSFITKILDYFSIDDEDDISAFSSAFNSVFYLMLHDDEIKDFEKALRTLIRGLVLQLVE